MVIAPGGALDWVPARDLAPGMLMRVAAGDRLAADGEIVSGASNLDQSLLTGSAPVPATMGDIAHAGTLNIDAPIDVCVTAAGHDTSLAEIAQLMEASGQARSAYVRIADRASRIYAPCAHAGAGFLHRLDADRGGRLSFGGHRHCRADHHLPLRDPGWPCP